MTAVFAEPLQGRILPGRKAKRGGYDCLVPVAPPKALGHLSNALSDAARERLGGELDKDFIHLPIRDLPAHLGKALAP